METCVLIYVDTYNYDCSVYLKASDHVLYLCFRGIEWTNLTSFLSFAYLNVSTSQGQVRNELFLTDTLTGNSLPLRTDKGDEAPIDMVRVSPLK